MRIEVRLYEASAPNEYGHTRDEVSARLDLEAEASVAWEVFRLAAQRLPRYDMPAPEGEPHLG